MKLLYNIRIFSLLLILLLAVSCQKQTDKNTVYFGGEIITMIDSIPQIIEAVWVKNGKIAKTGSKNEVFKSMESNAELVDLKGKTMIPAFIAVHTHPDVSAYLYDFVDLSGFTNPSPAEVWQKLQVAVKNKKSGEWIFCKGFDPMLVHGLRAPDIHFLDSLAPLNPVVIIAQSLHSAWGNTLAFEKAGINENTPDPAPGSSYAKDANGKLSGFIQETAAIFPFSKIAKNELDIVGNVVKVYDDYIKRGYGTITTMGIIADDNKPLMLYEYLSTKHPKIVPRLFDWFGILPDKKNTVRHFAYIRSQNASMFPESVENGDDFFKVLGLKVWYDGSPYTGSMYLSQAYQNSDLMQHGLNIPEGHFGEPVVDKQIFYDLVKKYHTMGWQVSIHSQGDQSTKEVLDMMEAILAETPDKDQRHRIEHGVLLPPELLDKVKALHMTASIHINHLYFYGNALIQDIIGRERAEKMLPVASLKAHGICYSLHADAPMYEEAPFSLLQTAVTRKTREGNVIGEHEKISVYDGLRSFTINSAWQLHMDEKLGTIEVGKYADFVVLDKNPLNTSVDSLRNIRVLSTIVNGEVLYSDN